MKKLIAILLLLIVSTVHAQDTDSRPFQLGFTPFPYEVSVEAVLDTYQHIGEDGDLIVHHFDNGVPWSEALAQQPYSEWVMDDWSFRRSLTPETHELLLTVTPIRLLRDGLALYRGTADEQALPAPFDNYTFDHPDVIAAFIHYCDTIIAYFQPDYFMFGVEVNLLMKNAPEQWDAYVTLHRAVYAHLKATYPDLPAFVSVTGIDLVEGYTDANHDDQMRALNDIIDYIDILGLSVYPYHTRFMTDSIPTELFDTLAALTDKPLAVTETGYPAQSFRFDAGGTFIEFDSDAQKQANWTRYLLDSAAEHQFLFVVNFIIRDYDQLWRDIGGREDLTIIWRDTGLYDENGSPRPSLDVWREWLKLPLNNP